MTPLTPHPVKPTPPAKVKGRANLPEARVMLCDFDPSYDHSVDLQVFQTKNEQSNPDLRTFPCAVIPCQTAKEARRLLLLPRTPEACAEMVSQATEVILASTRKCAIATGRRLGHPKRDAESFVEFCRSKADRDARAALSALNLLSKGAK